MSCPQNRANFTYEAVVEAERLRAAAAIMDSEQATAAPERLGTKHARAMIEAADEVNDQRPILRNEAEQEAERAARAEDALRRTQAELQRSLQEAEHRMRATGLAITGLGEELKTLEEGIVFRERDESCCRGTARC